MSGPSATWHGAPPKASPNGRSSAVSSATSPARSTETSPPRSAVDNPEEHLPGPNRPGQHQPSRHASGHPYQWLAGRDLDTPPGQVSSVLLQRLQPRQLQRPTGPDQLPTAADGSGDRYARAALAEELARVAAAPAGQRNRQLWESTRNLYNLVATGALI